MIKVILLILNVLLSGLQGTILAGTTFSGVLGSRVIRWSRIWIYVIISYLVGSCLLLTLENITVLSEKVQVLSGSFALLMSLLGIIFKVPVSPASTHCQIIDAICILGFGLLSALLSFLLIWTKKDGDEPMTFSMKFTPFLYTFSLSIPVSMFMFNVLRRFQVIPAILYSIPPIIFVLSAAFIYPMCRYFLIPWLKKNSFAKYPQELLEFANINMERATSIDELPVVSSVAMESSDEMDAVAVVQQAGLNLPQSVLNRLMYSPRKTDIESGIKRDVPLPSKKEQDRDTMHRQNERALMALRSEELYSAGLIISACLMMINTHISSSSWTEGLLSIFTGCLGILFGRTMAKHLGRELMPVTPSSAMLMITASFIVYAIGTISNSTIDTSTCMTFNFLGLAVCLHLRPPPSRDRKGSNQSTEIKSVVQWKRLVIILLCITISIIIGTSMTTGLLVIWP